VASHHRLLGAAYRPARLVNWTAERLGLASRHHLRVFLYHDVPEEEMGRLAEQLRWLARSWTFVTPDQFAAMAYGEAPVRGRSLLVTLDDGFASNRIAAERVLNPLGIRAVFFAVSEFVGIEHADDARRFIAERIQPGSHANDIPPRWRNMRWNDLEALLDQGHVIGGHTASHARLSSIDDSCLEQRSSHRSGRCRLPFCCLSRWASF
jgi:peptidoglycan/xylan/chitin deacetylase (PgdA/CDA1 family)